MASRKEQITKFLSTHWESLSNGRLARKQQSLRRSNESGLIACLKLVMLSRRLRKLSRRGRIKDWTVGASSYKSHLWYRKFVGTTLMFCFLPAFLHAKERLIAITSPLMINLREWILEGFSSSTQGPSTENSEFDYAEGGPVSVLDVPWPGPLFGFSPRPGFSYQVCFWWRNLSWHFEEV